MLELFRSPRRTVVWAVEASLLALLVFASAVVSLGWESAFAFERVLLLGGAIAVTQLSLYYHGLYGPTPTTPRWRATLTLLRALLIAGAVLWLGHLLVPGGDEGQRVLVAAFAAAALVLPLWRTAFQTLARAETFRRRALVLGSGDLARSCVELIMADEEGLGIDFVGSLVQGGGDDAPVTWRGVPRKVIGTYPDLKRIVAERNVEKIIVAFSDRRGTFPAQELLDLKFSGVEIEEGIDFHERVTGKIYVREIRPSQLIFASGFQIRKASLLLKRAFDVAVAGAMLVLTAPVMLLAAIAIKLDSRGPVLYSQVRAGQFGKPFSIHKFRSMRIDAEAGGAKWAEENDPRVTRVGRFIRKTRIDELPQLWNVLVGEMSMVGPRPERPVFIEKLNQEIPFFRQRLYVKPGITGHAQVRCRYGASMEDALEKLQYDLFYIKRFSIWFDLSVLFDTVKVVLLRIGAR